jgi:transcriptional regulator with XRE-family HTH domain
MQNRMNTLARNVRNLRERLKMSQTALAERVGVTQPTISRIELGGEAKTYTLEKIAFLAGVSIDDLTKRPLWDGTAQEPPISRPPPGPQLKLGVNIGVRDDAVPYVADASVPVARDLVAFLLDARADASPYVMRSEGMALRGICGGDVIIFDRSITPRNGDIVRATIEDHETLDAKTVVRVFQMPYLVGAGLDPVAVHPELVDGERVRIVGVMTELVRQRT